MNIKDRFLDFWNAPPYTYYTYDLSLAERMIYAVVGAIAGLIAIAIGIALVATMPIWAIPYLVYKSRKIKTEEVDTDARS